MPQPLVCLLVLIMILASVPILYDWIGKTSSPRFERLITFAQSVFAGALFMLLALLVAH